MKITEKEALHYILYQGLIEIREAALSNSGKNKINKISDLLHTLPMQLKSASNSDEYEVIMHKLLNRALQKNMHSWIDNVLLNVGDN